MNRLYKFLAIAVVALSATSCNDWLDDVKQTSFVDDAATFESEDKVDLYINGFYTYLSSYGQFGDRQFSGSWTEAMTDCFKYSGSNLTARAGQPNQYAELAVPMNPDGCLYSVWTHAYTVIRRLNQFLELKEKYSTFSEEKNLRWEAQARFFRAFMYFQLAKRHGGVILYDTLPTDGQRALSSEDETWDFITKDLDFCIENLPESWESASRGRVTKYAAYAFKSRCMLYAKRYQEAYDAAREVEKSGLYDLMSDYTQAWAGNNKESILYVEYDKDLGPYHSFDANYSPGTDGSTASCGAAPTQELVECYETTEGKKVDWTLWHNGTTTTRPPYEQLEPRFAATIIYNGCKWKGLTMDCSVQGPNIIYFNYGEMAASNGNTCSGYLLRKLLNENQTDVVSIKSEQSWVEIRYAEVLLNMAEAAYYLGKQDEANRALSLVRNRVGLPAKTSTGDEWLADYRNERKVELAFEGHLFWDMNRWRLCHTEYNAYRRHGMKIDNGTYTYVTIDRTDCMFDSKCYILPVPTDELKSNLLAVQYDNWK